MKAPLPRQRDMQRIFAAAKAAGVNVSIETLPGGQIRIETHGQDKPPASEADEIFDRWARKHAARNP